MAVYEDLAGQRFGRLVVLERAEDYISPKGCKCAQWVCKCDCGNLKMVTTSNLHGKTRSCGCLRNEVIAKDLTGQRFGRLLVIGRAGSNGRGDAQWLCRCDCGEQRIILRSALVSGATVSCGCRSKETLTIGREKTKHGLTDSRLYNIWCGMKNRTSENADDRHKRDYYDRGIRMCDEWREDFASFYSWAMKNGYAENLQIDRIDNDGDYMPANCRWVTPAENNRNRRKRRSNAPS